MNVERMPLINRLAPRQDERGAILVLAAVGMVVAVIAAALSVDIGRLAQDKRNDRRVADLAALDAVRKLPNPLDVQLAAGLSADRNGFPCAVSLPLGGVPCPLRPTGFSITAVPRTVSPTGVPGPVDPLVGPNAVEVTVYSRLKNAFAAGQHDVTATAVATLGNGHGCSLPDICVRVDGSPIGTVRVGSTLASVTTEHVILDKLLTQTMGGSYSLDAVGWQGLAAGNVSFGRLRTALGYSAGTADTVLDTNFTYRQLLDATVTALNADGSPSSVLAATKLATIATQVGAAAGATMTLRQLFNITGNVGGGKDVAAATINVKDIVVGGMTLADTDHLAALHLTAADIPGLPGNSVDVRFGFIEAPQTKSGPPKDGSGYRTIAHTGQIRLVVTVNVDISVVLPLALTATVFTAHIPYYLEVGAADAKLDTLTCPAAATAPTDVAILGTTDTARTVVGSVGDAALTNPALVPTVGPADLVNALGIVVSTGSVASVTVTVLGNSAGTMLHFSPADTAGGVSKHVASTALSLPSLTASNTTATGVGGSLVQSTLLSTVTALIPGLTTKLLNPLMKGLGLSYGGADIWAPPPQNCTPTSFNTDSPPVVYDPVPSLVG